MQSRDWQTQDGQKRNTVEVIADNIQFLRSGAKSGAVSADKKAPSAAEEVGTIDLNDEMAVPQTESPKTPGSSDEEAPF